MLDVQSSDFIFDQAWLCRGNNQVNNNLSKMHSNQNQNLFHQVNCSIFRNI